MKLLSFLVYLVLGYILWRIIRVVGRMLGGGNQESSGTVRKPTGAEPSRQDRVDPRTIKDAEFEDLTPPRAAEEGKKPPSV